MSFVLQVYEGVGAVREVALEEGMTLKIGRTQACDVVLTGPGISRVHCVVSCTNGVPQLENKSSTKKGTGLNGKPVLEVAVLSAGDELTVGELVIVLQAASEATGEKKKDKKGKGSARQKKKKGDSARAKRPPPPPAAEEEASAEDEHDPPEESEETAASEDADSEDAEEEGSARDRAQEFLRRKQAERNIKLVVGLVFLATLSGTVAWFGARVLLKKPSDTATGPEDPGGGTGDMLPLDRPRTGTAAADQAWSAVQDSSRDAMVARLEAFAEQHPHDPRAQDAEFYARQLRSAGRSAGTRRVDAMVGAMVTEAERLAKAKEPARAAWILELAASLVPGSPVARRARASQAELRESAAEAFEELQGKARAVAQRLGPVQGLMEVLSARARLRGLGRDDEIEALIAELEEQAARQQQRRHLRPELELSTQAITIENEGVNAALRFDFPLAWEKLDALLMLAMEEEQRLRVHWLRHHVRGLEGLFGAMIAAALEGGSERPAMTIRGKLRAHLVSADHQGLVLAPIVEEGSGELKWAWTRTRPFQVQELFAGLGLTDAGLGFAKAFHAFKTGLDDVGVEVLVPFARKKRHVGEVYSFYSLVTGTPLPEGGYVVFEGRFIDPDEKDRILAARAEAKEAAKALAAAAKEEKARNKLLIILQRVQALMDEGHYEAGRAAYAKLAKRHADIPGVGDVARQRFESPVLRRRDMRLSAQTGRNGPPANRLDIYMMGDGYQFGDKLQIAFDRDSNSAKRFLQLQDFYKEYDQYINYWAVNLESKEKGVSHDNEPKDTALGTVINGGTSLVADRGRVFRILEQNWPGEHDRQAVCIQNDMAGVATGGGGTVAVARTMLSVTPHEVGHSFGALGDEYDEEPGPNPGPPQGYSGAPQMQAANVVAGRDRNAILAMVRWKDWLDPDGTAPFNWTGRPIDLFEGANRQPRDYWRPQKACVMRDVGSPFCAVCMQVMVRRLYKHVRPIDQTWPEETEITAGRETITLRVLVMKPATHDLFVHWRRKRLSFADERAEPTEPDPDDPTKTRTRGKELTEEEQELKDISGKLQVIEGHYVHYIKIQPRKLKPGIYEFSAEVWDPTPWVLEKHRDELRQTHRWELIVPDRNKKDD